MFDLTYHKITVWLKDSSEKEPGVAVEIRIEEKMGWGGGESKENSR